MMIEQVYDVMRNIPTGVIAIDGELGSGKTTLSNKLSRVYGLPVIHVDDFLNQSKDQYVSAIGITELKEAIQKEKFPVIVEGICLLTILSKIQIMPIRHFFLYKDSGNKYKFESPLMAEIENYIKESNAPLKANKVITMNNLNTNQFDVDIAYIKSKTIVSVVLALGGIVALLVGAYVLSSGISSKESAIFEILGAKITAEGIGAVILSSSVFWAYFSYLAKPEYSRLREARSSTTPDGAHNTYEFETATMMAVARSKSDSREL